MTYLKVLIENHPKKGVLGPYLVKNETKKQCILIISSQQNEREDWN